MTALVTKPKATSSFQLAGKSLGSFQESLGLLVPRFEGQMNNSSDKIRSPLLGAALIENMTDSYVLSPATKSPPKTTLALSSWRAQRMYFIRHSDIMLGGLKDYCRSWLDGQAKIGFLQHESDRLENELPQIKHETSKWTRQMTNANKKIYQ